jgi:hypothetical protein
VTNDLEETRTEAAVASLQALPTRVAGGTNENRDRPHSEQLVSGPRSEPWPSQYEAGLLPAGPDARSCSVLTLRPCPLCRHDMRRRQKRDSNVVWPQGCKVTRLSSAQLTKGDAPTCNFGVGVTHAHCRFRGVLRRGLNVEERALHGCESWSSRVRE